MFCVMLSARVEVGNLWWTIYVTYVECTGGGGLFMFCVMLSAQVEMGNLCSVLC